MNIKYSTTTASIYSIIYIIPHHVYCSYVVTCDSKVHPIVIIDICINYWQMYWVYMIPHHLFCSYFVTCDSKAHPIVILIYVLINGKCTEYIWFHTFLFFLFCHLWFKGERSSNSDIRINYWRMYWYYVPRVCPLMVWLCHQ